MIGAIEEICERAVRRDGRALMGVPRELCSWELCIIASQQNESALKYAPKQLQDTVRAAAAQAPADQ